jgi:hypothetical protein
LLVLNGVSVGRGSGAWGNHNGGYHHLPTGNEPSTHHDPPSSTSSTSGDVSFVGNYENCGIAYFLLRLKHTLLQSSSAGVGFVGRMHRDRRCGIEDWGKERRRETRDEKDKLDNSVAKVSDAAEPRMRGNAGPAALYEAKHKRRRPYESGITNHELSASRPPLEPISPG